MLRQHQNDTKWKDVEVMTCCLPKAQSCAETSLVSPESLIIFLCGRECFIRAFRPTKLVTVTNSRRFSWKILFIFKIILKKIITSRPLKRFSVTHCMVHFILSFLRRWEHDKNKIKAVAILFLSFWWMAVIKKRLQLHQCYGLIENYLSPLLLFATQEQHSG